MQQLLLDKLEVTRTSASRTNVATPASRRSTLAVAGGKSNTNLQTPQVQAGGGHSRVGTANNGSNLLTNKNALREELRGALRMII